MFNAYVQSRHLQILVMYHGSTSTGIVYVYKSKPVATFWRQQARTWPRRVRAWPGKCVGRITSRAKNSKYPKKKFRISTENHFESRALKYGAWMTMEHLRVHFVSARLKWKERKSRRFYFSHS